MELSKDDFEFFETAMTDQEAANILRNMIKNTPAPRADMKSMIRFTFANFGQRYKNSSIAFEEILIISFFFTLFKNAHS